MSPRLTGDKMLWSFDSDSDLGKGMSKLIKINMVRGSEKANKSTGCSCVY